ncbi:MAG: hypothetical protein M9962_07925 [Oligoflexia bacterium]|nr:hypothetical protein [Oligoflexia bacterium]
MKKYLFLFFISLVGFSAELDRALQVRVWGNNHFQKSSVLDISGLTLDSSLSAKEIEKRLLNSGLFSSVRVNKSANNIDIFVQEKTRWFILPYAVTGSSATVGVAGGLVGIAGDNAKILGRMQKTGVTETASFYVKHDYIADSLWMLGFIFNYEFGVRDYYIDRDRLLNKKNAMRNYTIMTGYHINNALSVHLDHHYENHSFENLNSTNSFGIHISHRFFLEVNELFTNEGQMDGFWIKPYVEIAPSWSDFRFFQYGVLTKFSVFSHNDLNLNSSISFEKGNHLPLYQKFSVGGASLRGYPDSFFRTEQVLLSQNNLLITSWDVWKVKLRPLAFVDWAYIEKSGRTGIGAGLNVYFKNVAIPALQLFAGYGLNPKGFSFYGSIGPSL